MPTELGLPEQPSYWNKVWLSIKEEFTPGKVVSGVAMGTLFAAPQFLMMIPQMIQQKQNYQQQLKDMAERDARAKHDQQDLLDKQSVAQKLLYDQQKHDLDLRDQQQAAERVKEFERAILLAKGEKYLKDFHERHPELFKAEAAAPRYTTHDSEHVTLNDHAHAPYQDGPWTGA